jgi:hypothetical protein
VDHTPGICYCEKNNLFATIIAQEFFGMECKYWITSHGRIKCSIVVFLIIGVRSQFGIIFLISFLQLHHLFPYIHIRGEFSINAPRYHVAPQ